MTTPIKNREAGQHWHQIETLGESPTNDGRVQVVDAAAVQRMVAEFNGRAAADPDFPGLLIDADHLSHDMDKTTEAFGWLKELRVGEGGVPEGRIDWTDIGLPAIQNKRFKFFSTEYDPEDQERLEDGRIRPLRLSGLALTNRPRRKGGKPISNRQQPGESFQEWVDRARQIQNEVHAAKDKQSPADGGATKPTKPQTMKKLAEAMGLDPNATEEQILAKWEETQAKLKKLEEESGKAKAEAEAETILNRESKRIPEGTRDSWKAALIANREATEKVLVAMPEVTPAPTADKPRIFNREQAKTPTGEMGGDDDAKRHREQAAFVASIRNRDNTTFQRAWETARNEKPELFQ